MGFPQGSESESIPDPLRAAARALLAVDGREVHLRPWQIAYLIALTEGREGRVPPNCGAGRGWLQNRLDEAMREAEPGA
jgi:hypothetical protein